MSADRHRRYEAWHCYSEIADEFLIAYASSPGSLVRPQQFAIGHAIELYLKAVLVMHNPGSEPRGHDVFKLLRQSRAHEAGLLAEQPVDFERASRFMGRLVSAEEIQSCIEDWEHFVKHQEWYWIGQALSDLKYLGSPTTQISGPYAILSAARSRYWIPIIGELRRALRLPDLAAAGVSCEIAVDLLRGQGSSTSREAMEFLADVDREARSGST